MRTIFVGGPGRSGTSYVASRLGTHPSVGTLPGVELKLFTEKGGLLDLHHSLVRSYSPNRATVAMRQFRSLIDALVAGRFGQAALSSLAPPEHWEGAREAFLARLTLENHPVKADDQAFFDAAREFVDGIAAICFKHVLGHPHGQGHSSKAAFLEKTPHAILEANFLSRLAPGACFLHVMRDPRSVAHSLLRMRWGPDTLETCCTWVSSYCTAFLGTQVAAAKGGLTISCASIEQIAMSPAAESNRVCTALDLPPQSTLFDNADLTTLNGWVEQATEPERELLDGMLGGWAAHFGYAREAVGIPDSQFEAA